MHREHMEAYLSLKTTVIICIQDTKKRNKLSNKNHVHWTTWDFDLGRSVGPPVHVLTVLFNCITICVAFSLLYCLTFFSVCIALRSFSFHYYCLFNSISPLIPTCSLFWVTISLQVLCNGCHLIKPTTQLM